jgi:hypothetical protein
MNPRKTRLAYAGITTALLLLISVSGVCFQSADSSGLHGVCLGIWVLSGLLLALSQIGFLVIAVRTKRYMVLVLAGSVLLAITGFVFLMFNMPS